MKVKKTAKSIVRLHREAHGYPVVVQEEENGGYWVSCPAFEGCYSQGRTIDLALKHIQEAIALCKEEAPKAHREYIPAVSVHLVYV